MAAAFADGFIERHRRASARRNASHRLGGTGGSSSRLELHLAHRHEIESAELSGRALRFGIEGPDRFERVAEKIEPHRLRHARREKIEDAAAHRIFAGIAHARGPREPVGFEPSDERVAYRPYCPGAAENVSPAMVASGATRWSSALTVVERMRGRSKRGARAGKAREDQNSPRRNRGVRERPGHRAGNPRTENREFRYLARQDREPRQRRGPAGRRARHGRARRPGFRRFGRARASDRRRRRRQNHRPRRKASASRLWQARPRRV